MILGMDTDPTTDRKCAMCNTHTATVTLDLSELQMPVPLCGKCALQLLPGGGETLAGESTHTGHR